MVENPKGPERAPAEEPAALKAPAAPALSEGSASAAAAPPPAPSLPAVVAGIAATDSPPASPPPRIPPAPLAPQAPLIGSTVSHYRILERLGGGGMGVVYKGWDLRLERYAAVKFLSPHRNSSDDFKRRFTREARTASRLEHPNICTVFETDENDDGRLFIAMAFCEGESLKRKIERGPLPLAQALAVAAQVAAGLSAAHDKGVVHRDVKPGNIMVAEDGRVKIVDFGIARLADETRLTRTGDVMGTTAYISPEQFLSAETDHRTDLWSLGVVLYEMLTGRLPWTNLDERELINAIVKRQPRPISALRPGVPQALERIVARALAKRPVDRYQRADDLRADLLVVAELVAAPAPSEPFDQTVIEAPLAARERRPPVPLSTERGPAAADPSGLGRLAPADRGDSADAAAGDSDGRMTAGPEAPPAGSAVRGAPAPTGASAASIGTASAPAGGETGTDVSGPAAAERRQSSGIIGRVISHYRILGPLGGGGMGVVYQAQDLSLERVVALKFLPPELTRDPDAKTRFLQEARAASALDHPNICTIHEVGETGEGQLFLAMACYDGETLKQRLLRGPLPIDEALEIAQQVARGLVKAHRHGIVHRDIKPANLVITADEIVKILDFGIAKLAGAAGLTRIGASLGTPGYMSPEQARGEEVDPRTDVWSLGAVLYEMVTGRRPFRGDHDQAVLYALFNQEPDPVAQLRPDAPPELVRIVGRMLAKNPDERYLTAAEALADLRALYGPVTGTGTRTGITGGIAGGLTGTTSVPSLAALRPPPRRRWLSTAVIVAIVLGTALAAFLILRSGRFRSSPAQASFVRLTSLPGKETYPSLSPDGNFFAYAKSDGGRSHIYWQRAEEGANPTDLSKESPASDSQPAYSPDGKQIAFRSERDGGGIFVMGATGESVRRLTTLGFNPAWSPTGKEIVFATETVVDPALRGHASEIWRLTVDTGDKRRIAAGDGVQPAWSPGGSRIAYWEWDRVKGKRTIWTMPAAGGPAVAVIGDDHLNWNPVWSADGRYLFFASNRGGSMNLWRIPIDEASGEVLGEPEPLGAPAQWSAFMSFSRNGNRFVYATDEGKSNLERVELDPGAARVVGAPAPITQGPQAIRNFDASPDGRWIAFATGAPQENLFVIHPDGTGLRQLTNDTFKNRVPRWAPDSSLIAFYSNRGGAFQGWIIRPDGSNPELISPTRDFYNPVWSPDGKAMACSVGAHLDLSLIDLTQPPAGRRPRPLPLRAQPLNPFSWSPDGSRLLGVTGDPGVFVYSFKRQRYDQVAPGAARSTVWLHDGRRVIYVLGGRVMMADVERRTTTELLAPPPDSDYLAVCPSPDDHILYTLRSVQEGNIWLGTFR